MITPPPAIHPAQFSSRPSLYSCVATCALNPINQQNQKLERHGATAVHRLFSCLQREAWSALDFAYLNSSGTRVAKPALASAEMACVWIVK